jgi:hypothetical protein
MLEAFNCVNCGASLARSGDDWTCRYCGSTHRHPGVPLLACLLDDPQGRELARLDREWEEEQQSYMRQCRDGTRRPPTILGVLGGGVAYLLFMAIYNVGAWAAAADMARKADPPPAVPWAPYLGLPLLGVIFTGVGLAMLRHHFKQAWQYRIAQRRYQHRRAAVLGEMPPQAIPVKSQQCGPVICSIS